MNNLAAQQALTSTGVIGLTSLLLTKTFDIDLKVALPIGMATGLTFDYFQNMHTYRKSLRLTTHRVREYERGLSTGDPYLDTLLTGIMAILAITQSRLYIGRARSLFALALPPPSDDDDDDDPDGPAPVTRPSSKSLSWRSISRTHVVTLVQKLVSGSLRGLQTAIYASLSGGMFSRPPGNDAERELFSDVQRNMRGMVDEIVDTALNQVPTTVREDLDEKMPENEVNTIVPCSPDEVRVFESDVLPTIQSVDRMAVVEQNGRQVCLTFKGGDDEKVGEIPVVEIDHPDLAGQLEGLFAEEFEIDNSSSSEDLPPEPTMDEIREAYATRMDNLQRIMVNLYASMATFPVDRRSALRLQLEKVDSELTELRTGQPYSYDDGYLQLLDMRFERDNGHPWNTELADDEGD